MDEEKAKEWKEKYEALCSEGFQIGAVPSWMLRDDGTYSLVIQLAIVEKK